MPILDVILSLLLTYISFFLWKKLQDRNAFFIMLAGIIAVLLSAWALIDDSFVNVVSIVTSILFVIVGWYLWKRFHDRDFFWVSILSMISIAIKIYDYYIEENIFHLAGPIKLISLIPILIIRIGMIVILIKILLGNKKTLEALKTKQPL